MAVLAALRIRSGKVMFKCGSCSCASRGGSACFLYSVMKLTSVLSCFICVTLFLMEPVSLAVDSRHFNDKNGYIFLLNHARQIGCKSERSSQLFQVSISGTSWRNHLSDRYGAFSSP